MTDLETEELKKCSKCYRIDIESSSSSIPLADIDQWYYYWCERCCTDADEDDNIVYPNLPIPLKDLGFEISDENADEHIWGA